MSFACSLALVEEFSARGYLDTESSELLKSTRTAGKSSFAGRKRATWNPFPCGTTSARSTADRGVERWISSLRASRASRSVSRVDVRLRGTSETSGRTPYVSFARWDRSSRSWRTCQGLFEQSISAKSSETWQRAGLMLGGRLYRLPSWELPTCDGGSGWLPTPSAQAYGRNQSVSSNASVRPSLETMARKGLWPTPTAGDSKSSGAAGYSTASGRHSGTTLTDAVVRQRWPTPASTDWKRNGTEDAVNRGHSPNLPEVAGGKLNPDWVEWLMGWPIGWTGFEPLETGRFREWLSKHGED